ncbi:MAG: hypothetical protein ACR2P5_03580 [Gammaproteobacteria bacterium]
MMKDNITIPYCSDDLILQNDTVFISEMYEGKSTSRVTTRVVASTESKDNCTMLTLINKIDMKAELLA